MIRVELNEKSIMGEIRMVSDSKEEYDEFANKMIELSDLCEKNVNSYIMSTGKLDNLDSLTEKEDMNITNIITRAVDDMYELLKCELGEDKFGNETTIFTYIGHADFRKNNNKIEVKEEYKDLIEKVFSKYNK